ncbi:MAG: carbamoyltransferase HypF [Desulfobacterales bacterium]|nr:carbamoyltransferase HypF [Desulfobacterales bacterium]
MAPPPVSAKRLEISGVVQGVGFRPFLFGLAHAHALCGRVSNTAGGVDLLIEGPPASLEAFVRDIDKKKPVLSRISGIKSEPVEVRGYTGFKIVKSKASSDRSTLISPDVSICRDCLAEMLDPGDRRFEYPFINCTNCGPRYTIIRDIPYDRPKTSMEAFPMCPACRAEYENPMDRRFHAQPNACPVCGPQVFLTDNSGARVDDGPAHALELAAKLLGKGKILAVKGLGGFHLAVDARDEIAVSRLRRQKKRPDKPFALMAASESELSGHVLVDEKERQLLTSFHRPIVLLDKRHRAPGDLTGLAPSLAPYNTCLGVMLPYTPLHYLLLAKGPGILVMTSGNRSGEPLSIDNEDALDAFSHIADYFLFHNRDIYFRADDSIARIQKGKKRFIRRSRGYAPLPLDLKLFSGDSLPKVLGCGAGLKSTICLTRDRYGFLSQHIGDLENPKVHRFYDQTIDHMQKIMDIEPETVAHDLHPGYYSTAYAGRLAGRGLPLVGVQHHHAHALACMAENRLDGEVMALTLDGTGFGTDGHIWGGEILTCTYGDFQRKARLAYIPMPGGDAAVKEPWRMAAALLFKAFGSGFPDLDIPYIRAMDRRKLEFIVQMMEKQLNSPLTSSAGRMFDAVASLLGICHEISHESQAAMELESLAAPGGEAYPFEIHEGGEEGCRIMDLLPVVRAIVHDIREKTSAGIISARFHSTLVKAFTGTAEQIRRETGLDRIVLSGGVFNNNRILTRTVDCLESGGFSVYTHSRVPCGDGGIALGQAMAAAAQLTGVI